MFGLTASAIVMAQQEATERLSRNQERLMEGLTDRMLGAVARVTDGPTMTGVDPAAPSTVANIIAKPKSRAERLLRRTLPRKEWHRYMIKGYVLVRGSKGGLYQLTKKKAYGVNRWQPKKETICTVPADISDLDPADFIVAQYLALMNDEKGFIKKSNKSGSYNGPSGGSSMHYNGAADAARDLQRHHARGGGEFLREYESHFNHHEQRYESEHRRYENRDRDHHEAHRIGRGDRRLEAFVHQLINEGADPREVDYVMEHLLSFENNEQCTTHTIDAREDMRSMSRRIRLSAHSWGDRHPRDAIVYSEVAMPNSRAMMNPMMDNRY